MNWLKTVQAKLFLAYAGLITLLIIIFATSFYLYVSRALEQKASESIHQLSLNISDKFDAELRGMDAIAGRVITSDSLRTYFFESTDNPTKELNNRRNLSSTLFSITGYPFQFKQIHIFGVNGKYIEFGKNFDVSQLSPDSILSRPWVHATLAMDGRKTIIPPRKDDWDQSNTIVFSLCRAFTEVLGEPLDSIVEVQQDYSIFENIVNRSVAIPGAQSSHSIKVYVYDKKGVLIYPLSNPQQQADTHWNVVSQLADTSGIVKPAVQAKMDEATKTSEIVAYSRSEFSGLTVLLVESETALLQPVKAFRTQIILIGIAALLLTMIVTYYVARGLTTPIKAIRKSIASLNLQTLPPKNFPDARARLNELEELQSAYIQMCERLEASLSEAVEARSQEIKARMLALQAQMNPHFLYNTLTVISIKADNNHQHDIVKMCSDLSGMLRYIAVDGSAPVTIAQEMDYTRKYLDLMKSRYSGHFTCTIDIPIEMNSISVPRLIIQPIVENCFKHAFDTRPPWHIYVIGAVTDAGWEMVITDNGIGFDEQALMNLSAKMDKLERPAEDSDPHIGLLNIYDRLKVFYGEKAVFQLLNTEHGARVRIGGPRSEEGNDA
ncbi:cache domain-containing sensor histidine kinase [Paenibacillus guangzhouensis]|uniref:cache domain-containing sensor histidine kinase n=1 Tax=Paenibacillus guangzhouensis TaxID=1473112 RepID=UPI0012675E75|nr:sensor histidine kinase [Paenibacillus guangzhouensis]